jgi:hypothetical protein
MMEKGCILTQKWIFKTVGGLNRDAPHFNAGWLGWGSSNPLTKFFISSVNFRLLPSPLWSCNPAAPFPSTPSCNDTIEPAQMVPLSL